MNDYRSFTEFMESAVLPHQEQNPSFIRLDGASAGGNREVYARFKHKGRLWKVHADTHFELLRLAYEAIKRGEVKDPFTEDETKTGSCLVLVDEVRRRQKSKHKHLYIYSVE